MFTFENVRHCMWRNVYSPQPVLAGTVLFGSAFAWTTEHLSPALLSVFDQKLPGAVDRSVSLAAPDLVARLAQRIQLLGDVVVSLLRRRVAR